MSEIIQNLLEQLNSEAVLEYVENLDHLTAPQVDSLIAKFEALINLDPDNKYVHTDGSGCGFDVDALIFLPDLYIKRKEYEKARIAIVKVINDNAHTLRGDELYGLIQSGWYRELGMVLYRLGQIDSALACLDLSIKLSNNYEAFLIMSLCCRKKGNISEARTNLATAKALKALAQLFPPIQIL